VEPRTEIRRDSVGTALFMRSRRWSDSESLRAQSASDLGCLVEWNHSRGPKFLLGACSPAAIVANGDSILVGTTWTSHVFLFMSLLFFLFPILNLLKNAGMSP